MVGGFDATTATFHDPHCVRLCLSQPGRLYQQNHCGIYRLDRTDDPSSDTWQRIGRKMPKRVGDIGLPVVVHPRDADTAWVSPMDGTDVWPRTGPACRPAAYVTRNAGRTWQRPDQGLPESQARWTVKRLAMTADTQGSPRCTLAPPVASCGWAVTWARAGRPSPATCPEIYAVEVAELA